MGQYPDTIEITVREEHLDRAITARTSSGAALTYTVCKDCVMGQAVRDVLGPGHGHGYTRITMDNPYIDVYELAPEKGNWGFASSFDAGQYEHIREQLPKTFRYNKLPYFEAYLRHELEKRND